MNAIGVFARQPVAGKVKTRLSPALPAGMAAQLYAGMLADTFAAAERANADERWMWWADDAPSTAPPGWRACQQSGADLGERLTDAMAEMRLAQGDRVLIVGSDAPGLSAAHLDAAIAALAEHDVVVGPASDGGYWLVGASRECAALFRKIPWSSPDVLASTLARAEAASLRVATLEQLADIDEPADLAKLVAQAALDPGAVGASTRAALERMGLLIA